MTVERLGLVGLPNAGKSSLFNALTGAGVTVAPHPFSTTETTVGAAAIPDFRLDALAEMSKSKKVVHATFEVVDIAGLVAGSSGGEGLGNRFLAQIREVDAICYVLRAFRDPSVVDPASGDGDPDPVEALSVLELELVLADAESLEGQLARRRKAAKQDRSLSGEIEAGEAALEVLSGGTPLYRSSPGSGGGRGGGQESWNDLLKGYFMLTAKPVIAVVNLGEDQLGTDSADEIVKRVATALDAGADVLGVCVQLEAEAAALDPAERSELLAGLGLGDGALPRFSAAALHVLGRRTFFTTGEKESRAWTFRAGALAPECAGVIHSDLQRGFIRAEVIGWEELIELGSWQAAKAAGKLRVEGKDYAVQDGDVMEIRFNV
jgi:GTP-binding protein YchF